MPAPLVSPGDFAAFLARHTVLVAEADGRPVGYVAGRDLGDLYWMAELGVDPAFGRRGIGRRLVAAICGEAKALFHRAIGLTTYRDVPFNAPFYAKCGFLTVPHQPGNATFEERLVAETPVGACPRDRVAMVKWL